MKELGLVNCPTSTSKDATEMSSYTESVNIKYIYIIYSLTTLDKKMCAYFWLTQYVLVQRSALI